MGVHPANRGGMYPQADAVRNLGLKIIRTGFSQSEANHEGVVVEEVPFCKRADHSRSSGIPYESYAEYNVRNCDHQYLARRFLNALGIIIGQSLDKSIWSNDTNINGNVNDRLLRVRRCE